MNTKNKREINRESCQKNYKLHRFVGSRAKNRTTRHFCAVVVLLCDFFVALCKYMLRIKYEKKHKLQNNLIPILNNKK